MKWFFFSNVTVATGGVSSSWAGLGWAGPVWFWLGQPESTRESGARYLGQARRRGWFAKFERTGWLAMLPIVSLTAKPQGRKNHRAIVTREPHPQHRRLLYAPRRSIVKHSEPLSSAQCPARCQLHIERCCECEDQLYRVLCTTGWMELCRCLAAGLLLCQATRLFAIACHPPCVLRTVQYSTY